MAFSLTVSFSVPIKPQREAKHIQTSERREELKCVSKTPCGAEVTWWGGGLTARGAEDGEPREERSSEKQEEEEEEEEEDDCLKCLKGWLVRHYWSHFSGRALKGKLHHTRGSVGAAHSLWNLLRRVSCELSQVVNKKITLMMSSELFLLPLVSGQF